MGDMRPLENRSLDSIYSNFTLSLDAGETVSIITKYKSTGNLEIGWNISDIKDFISLQNIDFTLIFLYIGLMSAIMFSKIFTYYYIKDKIYLIYAVFVLSAIVTNGSNIGTMHYFFSSSLDNFTISMLGPIFSHIFLASLWIFTYYFFLINKKSAFFYPFVFIILYNILITLLYIYAYIDIGILKIIPIVLLIALVESILLLVFSFIMFVKRKAGSSLFLLAHIFYISSIIYYILNLSGKQQDPVNSMLTSSLGIFLATYLMSLSLSSRFKVIKEENDSIKQEFEKNKQYTLIGTTISYVTHQWKQPLSILSLQMMKIEALLDHKPNTKIEEITADISNMQQNISFINETLSNIKVLFKIDTNKKVEFKLEETLNSIKNDFNEISVKINIEVKHDSIIYGNQNLFINAIKNIIQNSIDAIYENKIKNGLISITNITEEDILLSISDNAGGISKQIKDSIFEKSNSKKMYGMGIGLSITKDILNNEFKSDIKIEDIKNGTKFIIRKV